MDSDVKQVPHRPKVVCISESGAALTGPPGAIMEIREGKLNLEAFLHSKNKDQNGFTDSDYQHLTKLYQNFMEEHARYQAAVLDYKKRAARVRIDDVLISLNVCIEQTYLKENSFMWERLVSEAAEKHRKEKLLQNDTDYRQVAMDVWTFNIGTRKMAFPDSFFKDVKKAAAQQYQPKLKNQLNPDMVARNILSDMNRKFNSWGGKIFNRGAYWGASGPNAAQNALSISAEDSVALKNLIRKEKSPWQLNESRSSGLSYKRFKGSVAFIYHLRSSNR